MKPDLVWSTALGELQLQMTQATFDTWLRDSRFIKFEDDAFTIGVKTGYAKDWLEHRLLTTIKRTLARLTGRTIVVKFVVYEEDERRRPEVVTIDEASSSDEAPSDNSTAPSPSGGGRGDITIETAYGEARAELQQPDEGIFVTAYNIKHFMQRLRLQRWCLVQLLRLKASEGKKNKDGTRSVETSNEELAALLGISKRTVQGWLAAEPVPDDKGWHRIKPVDEASRTLALFIPKMKLNYHRGGQTGRKGRLILIRMDDPLIPEDEARLGAMALDRVKGAEPPPPEDVIRQMIFDLDLSVTDGRVTRHRLRPIAERIAALFDDEHSFNMYYGVLKALHRAKRLDLFLAAMDAGLEAMQSPTGWKPGIAFVEELKTLGEEEDLEVGIKRNDG
jgi:hypothetical protein